MNQAFGPRLLRLPGDVQGALPVDPVERGATLLDVVANGIPEFDG